MLCFWLVVVVVPIAGGLARSSSPKPVPTLRVLLLDLRIVSLRTPLPLGADTRLFSPVVVLCCFQGSINPIARWVCSYVDRHEVVC